MQASRVLLNKVSLIPPNIGTVKELGKLQSKYPQAHPVLFARLKQLYANLPKGSLPAKEPATFGQWYRRKYIDSNSPAPLVHFLFATMCAGYYSIMVLHGHYHPSHEFH